VTRCRRRVHLDHDPAAADAPRAAPDPAVEQRITDAAAHRRAVAGTLARHCAGDWAEVPPELPAADRIAATRRALDQGLPFIWGGLLPPDGPAGRRGSVELLVRHQGGYLPVIMVRHKITDPGSGARTSPLEQPLLSKAQDDPQRRVRAQPRDQ